MLIGLDGKQLEAALIDQAGAGRVTGGVLAFYLPSLIEVKTTQHGVMQFVIAHFEVHLWAVDRPGPKIVEPGDDFFLASGFHYQAWRDHNRGLAAHFLPLLSDLFFVKEYDSQLRYFVDFSWSRWIACAAFDDKGGSHSGFPEKLRAHCGFLEEHNT